MTAATAKGPEGVSLLTLEYSPVWGYRIDGNVVQFWGSKKRAVRGAAAISWPASSLVKVWTRFQCGYALCQEAGGLLTKVEYNALLSTT